MKKVVFLIRVKRKRRKSCRLLNNQEVEFIIYCKQINYASRRGYMPESMENLSRIIEEMRARMYDTAKDKQTLLDAELLEKAVSWTG